MPDNSHVAVITGASSGIGRSIAKLLGSNGITVCLGARSKLKLESIVNEIKTEGGIAYSFYLDLTDNDSIQTFIEKVNKTGSVKILINNSGFGKFDKIDL